MHFHYFSLIYLEQHSTGNDRTLLIKYNVVACGQTGKYGKANRRLSATFHCEHAINVL
jgi:hypothetical protein